MIRAHRYVCPCPWCARKRATNHLHSGIAFLAAVAAWGVLLCVEATGGAPSWAVILTVALVVLMLTLDRRQS